MAMSSTSIPFRRMTKVSVPTAHVCATFKRSSNSHACINNHLNIPLNREFQELQVFQKLLVPQRALLPPYLL